MRREGEGKGGEKRGGQQRYEGGGGLWSGESGSRAFLLPQILGSFKTLYSGCPDSSLLRCEGLVMA